MAERRGWPRSSAAASAGWPPRSACRRRALRTVLFEARDQPGGRAYVYQDQGFTFDAGPDRDHRAALPRGAVRARGRAPMADHVELLPVRPFYRLFWADGTRFDYGGDPEPHARADRRAARPATPRATSASSTTAGGCSRPATRSWRPTPFLRFADMVRVAPAAGAAARRPLGLRRRSPLRERRAPAPGAVVPLAADRRQPVRDQRDLHADPLPRAQVGRVLPARRHRRAGAGAGGAVPAARRRAAAGARPVERVDVRERGGGPRHHVVDRRAAAGALRRRGLERRPAPHLRPALRAARRAADARRARLERMDWSMSLFVLYFGTRRTYPGLRAPHGAVRAALPGAAARHLPRPGAARRTSASTCTRPRSPIPAWRRPAASRFYVLAPGAPPRQRRHRLGSAQARPTPTASWRRSRRAAARPAPGHRDPAASSRRSISSEQLNAYQGSAFSLAPRLGQSAWFRPHNRDPHIPGPLHRRRRHAPGRRRARGDQLGQGHGAAGPARTSARRPRRWRHDRRRRRRAHDPGAPTRRASRWPARLLPARCRDDAAVLYAWCRRGDDAIDRAPDRRSAPRARGPPARRAGRRLHAGRRRPIRCWPRSRTWSRGGTRSRARYADELIDGMAMDVGRRALPDAATSCCSTATAWRAPWA